MVEVSPVIRAREGRTAYQMPSEKQCPSCLETKPVAAFGKPVLGRDGVGRPQGWCSACRSSSSAIYQAKRRAKIT